MTRISLLLLALMFCAFAPQDNKINFSIQGTATDMDGRVAYLRNYKNGQTTLDSTVVKNGSFTFKGAVDTPEILRIDLSRGYANVLVQNTSDISVNMTTGREGQVTDNGGVNDTWRELFGNVRQMMSETMMAASKIAEEQNIGMQDALKKLDGTPVSMETVFGKVKTLIGENRDNLAGVMLLSQIMTEIKSLHEADSLIALVPLSKNTETIQKMREALALQEKTNAGKMFADFKGVGIDGSEVSLSDYVGKGKYVIVDFWASWCVPCKIVLPTLRKVQQKYGSENLVIVGVSAWDKWENFQESTQSDEMPWNHIYTEENSATKVYGIQAIPEIILFAPDGTIVARSLYGEAIETTLKEKLVGVK